MYPFLLCFALWAVIIYPLSRKMLPYHHVHVQGRNAACLPDSYAGIGLETPRMLPLRPPGLDVHAQDTEQLEE